jgi:hypothetical protein
MFTSVDKMIAAFVASGVMIFVTEGWISEEQGAVLSSTVVTLITAAVTGVVTYLVPNKS